MVEDFTVETFEGLVGQAFKAQYGDDGERTELTLTAAEGGAHDASESKHRDPFSLTFHEEGHAPKEQGIWKLEHGDVGAFELFLVPHAADAHGVDYGAHFN